MKTSSDKTSYQGTSTSSDDESEFRPLGRTSGINTPDLPRRQPNFGIQQAAHPLNQTITTGTQVIVNQNGNLSAGQQTLEVLENTKHPVLHTGNNLTFLDSIRIPSLSSQRHVPSTQYLRQTHTPPTHQSTSTHPILGDPRSKVEVGLEFTKMKVTRCEQTVEKQRIEMNKLLRVTVEYACQLSSKPPPPIPTTYRRQAPPPPPPPTSSLALPPSTPPAFSQPYRYTFSSSKIGRGTQTWDGKELSIPYQTDSQPGAWVGNTTKWFWRVTEWQEGPDLIDLGTAEFTHRRAIQEAVIKN
jgi:hypothetical protein